VAAGLGLVGQVIVVDNSGRLPEPTLQNVTVVRPPRNLGFGAGVNLAARHARGSLMLVLNPDARIGERDMELLVTKLLGDVRLAAVGPRLRSPDGTPQVNGGSWSGWARELSRSVGAGPAIRRLRAALRREVRAQPDSGILLRDWLSGAVLLIRRSAFEAVGGFDETFFLYYEDEDLCRRLRRNGWRVGVCPRASALHAVGGSVEGDPYLGRSFEESRSHYHWLHSGPVLRRFVRWDAQRRLSARAGT
jgi:N-acetylglucosaminyl-diphospho-decaprenol L-rhamnosyltransferase